MTVYYLDASALLKRYVKEIGTEVMDSLLGEKTTSDAFTTSMLAVLEINASFRRLQKGRLISQRMMERSLIGFWRDVLAFEHRIPLTDVILDAVLDVVATHALRAGDAIHLASVLEVQALSRATDQPLVVFSSDNELLAACQAEGISTLNPEDSDAMDSLLSLRTSTDA